MSSSLKSFLSLIFVFSATISNAALIPYRGQIQKKQQKIYLTTGMGTLLVSTTDADIRSSLEKLKEEDLISGLGDVDTSKNEIMIQSIDYIGLMQLVGSWRSTRANMYMIVPNFSQLSWVGPTTVRWDPSNSPFSGNPPIKNFVYSIHASDDRGFNLFLSDDQQTVYGELILYRNTMRMRLYHPVTGELNDILEFKKMQ